MATNSWTRDLRQSSSVAFGSGVSRGKANTVSSSSRAGSPRGSTPPTGATSYTKLLQITKDHESLCSHLMASSKQMQDQLRALRVEHDALRAESHALLRCLDRAGVLPIAEVEKEKSFPMTATIALDATVSNGSVQSLGSPSEKDVVRESQAQLPSLSMEPADLSSRAGALASAALSSSSVSSAHDSGLNPTVSRLNLDHSEPIEEVAQDLYELCQPLFDRSTSLADQQRSLRLVTQYLKSNPEPPLAWQGPSSPLHSSVKAGRVDLTRLLLRAKSCPNERDAKGVSPLHLATFDGNVELCRTLISGRADVDLCDRHGQTSLFFAPGREVCKLLVEKKADMSVLNRKGQSALHLAGRAGLQEVLAWLSSRVTRPLLELKDVHGATARMYAMQAGLPSREVAENHVPTNANRNSMRSASIDSQVSIDTSKTAEMSPIASPGDNQGRLASTSEALMDQPLTPLDMSPSEAQGSYKFGASPQNKSGAPSYPIKKTSPPVAKSSAQVVPRPLPKAPETSSSPQKSRPSSSSQSSPQPQSKSGSYAAYRSDRKSNQPPAPQFDFAAYRSDRKSDPKINSSSGYDPAACIPYPSTTKPPVEQAAPQQFDMRSNPDIEEDRHGDSLEGMYNFDKAIPAKETVAALTAAAEVASVAVRTASELNREEELKRKNDELREIGVLDDLEAVGVLDDVSLREAGVLDGLAFDDSMMFDELTPDRDRERSVSSDLANEGVMDDDLANSGVFFDDVSPKPTKRDLESEGVLDDGSRDAKITGRKNSNSKADLAEIGVMDDEDDLADLGVLNDEDDLAELGVGLPDPPNNRVYDDKAALAEIGVLEDPEDLADVGVFDGDDDEALAAAGVFMDLAPPRMALDSVPEEGDEDEEEEGDEYLEEEEEEEEEDQIFGDDDDEECW